MASPPRPVVTAECLRAELPVAVTFAVSRGSGPGHLDTLAIKAIAASNAAPSRDGSYMGVVPIDSRPGTRELVTWAPHNGLPAYPEIRCALQARLPAAFRRPLNKGLARPKLDSTIGFDSPGGLNHGDRDPSENMRELSDIRLDLPDADRQREPPRVCRRLQPLRGWSDDGTFARRIVGWRVSRRAHAGFVLDALEQALHDRRPVHGTGLVHHSDRGVQYVSIRYTERLAEAGIEPSVGSAGDSYDNALAESVIGLFKTEVIRRRGPWHGIEGVEFATLEWVDWFNNRRLLEPIGNIPPAEAEARYYAAQEATPLAA